ncbi:hypothetical protein CBFG_03804 [Clostridiales bacterium 1_7_47FAA]|nr:hypothetical protein CBFG_03804 [Clostridiales bacterium 1_7_47FAA]
MDRNLPAILCTEKSTKGCRVFEPDRKNDTWVRGAGRMLGSCRKSTGQIIGGSGTESRKEGEKWQNHWNMR